MILVATREALAATVPTPTAPFFRGRADATASPPLPEDAAAPLLSVRGVSLEYRTPERVVRATHRVDFDVHAADRFVLLGPSGCGKSTLLKAVAGFHWPVEGEILLGGVPVREPGPDRIVVFQEFDQLPPWKTVAQNVAFPLRATGTVGRREAEAPARPPVRRRPRSGEGRPVTDPRVLPPIRPEYDRVLAPFVEAPVERILPLPTRLWQQGWLRKGLILAVLALAWELLARWNDNDLLLPGFLATLSALAEGLTSGELLERVRISLVVLAQGYLAGIVLAFLLTTLAVSTQFGRDLLSTLTAMFNPLPAIALLPLALLWFGLGSGSLVFVLIHAVLWPMALNTFAGFQGVPETLRMAGRNYGLKGLPYVRQILIPAALPAILSGLKIGWAFAWRTLIAAELVFGAPSGKGGLGQGRPRLVHLPEPERTLHRPGVRRAAPRHRHRSRRRERRVRDDRAGDGPALGHGPLRSGWPHPVRHASGPTSAPAACRSGSRPSATGAVAPLPVPARSAVRCPLAETHVAAEPARARAPGGTIS